ncbi:MAG TPA: two-component sensor histidine kinase [Desulfobacteraceae bacterium]|nr:two-component sensor histidine kinase [Desulfobacteraceae bacterium]
MEKDKQNIYYKMIARKMVITIIMVSITPMVLVSLIIFDRFKKSYHGKVGAHLDELVQKHKQNIDTFLKERLGNIKFLAKTSSYEELKQEIFLQKNLLELQKAYNNVFVDLGTINAKGAQLAYAGPFQLKDAQYSDAEWFKNAAENKYYISDVFLGLRGLPHFIVTVKKNFNGQELILRATIDVMAFNSLVENLRIGKTGFAYIINKKGNFQTKASFDVNPEKKNYADLLKKIKEAKNGERLIEKKDEDSGEKLIYVLSLLKGGDWLMVYQQDYNDAFSSVKIVRKIAHMIFGIGTFCIVLMAVFLSWRIVKRIAGIDKEKEMLNQQVVETGKLASVGELAAGIAHEINNPVAIMVEESGWMEDLLEEEDLQKTKNLGEFRRSLKQIKTQGKRCKEITYKLLSFARKTDSRIDDVHVNEIIDEVVSLSEQRAKYAKVFFNTNLGKDLPLLSLSKSEMQQVLLNFFNNALDAMEKTGGNIDITSYFQNNNVIVGIKDNGPGIPKANLARIFDPFFTTKPVGKGTGLGLAICYGIIKKMGGDIKVQSSINVGTTFIINLPISEQKKGETDLVPDNLDAEA